MGFFSQLSLLLWKNALLQKKKVVVSIFEIVLPIGFACIIVLIRSLVKPTLYPNATRFDQQHDPMDTFDVKESYLYRQFLRPYLALARGGGFNNDVLWEVGFVPNTTVTRRVMEDVNTAIVNNAVQSMQVLNISLDTHFNGTEVGGNITWQEWMRSLVPMKPFNTEEEMVEYYMINADTMKFGVVFKHLDSSNDDVLPSTVSFSIRPWSDGDIRWRTANTFPFFQTGVPRYSLDPDYKLSNFLMLQTFLSESLTNEWLRAGGRSTSVSFNVEMHRMPYPPYADDPMVNVLQNQLPLFLVLSFILSVIQTTKNIVYEKERKLKESMKLMGLMPAAHWLSWFITAYIYLAVSMAVYALLFGLNIVKKTGPVLACSDPSLFYVFLLCYAVAIVTFCFMISVFVQKANVGAAVAGVMFFGFYLPNFFIVSRYEIMTSAEKIAASLLFNQAMSFGANVIGRWEGTGDGARWSNVYKKASVDDNYTLLDSMIMLLIDSAIHLLITWYLDNVRPGDFGVPKPFYFCFLKSYWCGPGDSSDILNETQKTNHEDKHFERDPVGLKAGIRICNLRKKFKKNKVAVDNLSLNMYEGQITVLLGHNGAGKTTTMSMLTGFIPPTSGTAYIDGKNIRTDIDRVRESLGLCPQHNILFGSLTVQEHLVFFARLKGCPRDLVMAEVKRLVQEVGLQQKLHSPARTLSGGQKRKLSVAIALISGSKIVVLDEPSSGMDPAARRQMWEVLQRNRHGRTMLLTTHFMDEADVLGDRIAIMAEGVVKCCGTSHFLKKLYGAGYHLVIVKGPDCQVAAVTELITSTIASASFEREINAELVYLLPDDQSQHFPKLLRELEAKKGELHIRNFGATATTMEEVFLKVGESASSEEDDPVINKIEGIVNGSSDGSSNVDHKVQGQKGASQRPQNRWQTMTVAGEGAGTDILAFSRGFRKVEGLGLALSRLRGLLVKKAIHFWRNRLITMVQLLLPVIFTVIALAIEDARPKVGPEPALAFSLEPFGRTTVAFSNGSNDNNETSHMAERYKALFGNEHDTHRVDQPQTDMTEWYVECAHDVGTSTYNKRVIVGADFDNKDGRTLASAWYNGQPYHSKPIALAFALNALAQSYVNSSVHMNMAIYPLPNDAEASNDRTVNSALASGFSIGFCISIGMAFLTASFIFFLIKERTGGAKHLQMVSGVGPVTFWVSNLVWDYINYLLPSMLLLVVFAAYNQQAFVEDDRLGLVVLILVMFGLAILPFMYFAHFAFSSGPAGMVAMIVFNIFTGLVTMVTVFIMALIDDVRDLGETLNWVFLALFPNHCMSKAFMDVYSNYVIMQLCKDSNYKQTCLIGPNVCCKNVGSFGCGTLPCMNFTENFLDWESPGIGRYLVFMVIQGVLFFTLTLMLEFRILHKLCGCYSTLRRRARYSINQPYYINGVSLHTEDDDVAAERRRINASPAFVLSQREPLLLVNLYKQYGNFVAVDHTCVGVPEQECFGLLGQNGAGKTTTFKMLTGDVPVSGGNAYLKGFDVKRNLQQVQANMGYCPQFDALIEQMTGRETLTMYARLRGVPEVNIRACVNSLIDVLLLRPHADKLTSDYSGGNKRKLSTAIALIGDPPFILLDEPSSGMDPAARRQLWNVLSQVRASGRTLVLTSHSMEECEALCTRIAIMVNGRFVCLGSQQHLKSKFGQGYTIIAKMGTVQETEGEVDSQTESTVPAPVQALMEYIQDCFPNAKLFDSHQGYAHMQVPDPNVRLADVFEAMEQAKQHLHVEDYNVHQTTLEQVFLAFTALQRLPKDEEKKSCLKRFCCCCRT